MKDLMGGGVLKSLPKVAMGKLPAPKAMAGVPKAGHAKPKTTAMKTDRGSFRHKG